MSHEVVSIKDWRDREVAWNARVNSLGAERAVYHKRHRTPEDFAAITKIQEEAIWPILLRERTPADHLVLDFGCGHGRWTTKLATTFGYAVGIDPTPTLLAKAMETKPSNGVEFKPYFEGYIPLLDNSVDVLWSCMVLSTVLDPAMFQVTLEEMCRVVHVNSLVVIIDNTSMDDGRPVRSPYSISRSVGEYQDAFAPWVKLTTVGAYTDFGEVNTIFCGRVHG
jgi:ubiquinone/menaquinone biosynthesis C-methylase UbiE